MPRPAKKRHVCGLPLHDTFSPPGATPGEPIRLTVEEYEAIRLIDLEQYTQEECAGQMGVSRTTVQGIYDAARRKIADALVNGKRLVIAGGHYAVCHHGGRPCGRGCRHARENTSCGGPGT